MFDGLLGMIGAAVPVVVAVIAVIIIFVSGYVKASPDTAYIISGLRKNPKVLIGKAGLKIPFLEKKDELLGKYPAVIIRSNSTRRETTYGDMSPYTGE